MQVNARCASEGICGGCTVILEEGQFVVADQRVTVSPDNPRSVLACQTMLAGRDATIRFPRNSIVEQEAKIDEDFSLAHFTYEAPDPQVRDLRSHAGRTDTALRLALHPVSNCSRNRATDEFEVPYRLSAERSPRDATAGRRAANHRDRRTHWPTAGP